MTVHAASWERLRKCEASGMNAWGLTHEDEECPICRDYLTVGYGRLLPAHKRVVGRDEERIASKLAFIDQYEEWRIRTW